MYPGGQIISGSGKVQKPYGQKFDTPSEGDFKSQNENAKKFAKGYAERFKSNMADYFDKDTFDFTGQSQPGGVDVGDQEGNDQQFQAFPNFAVDYGPKTSPIGIQGTAGQPGILQQIAGPIAGAAASSFFACDINLKHDIDYLTDMDLIKDDLAEIAYFVKDLQDS